MQSQTAEARVYAAPLSFLDEEPEPSLHVLLDDDTRREARAELHFLSGLMLIGACGLLLDLAFVMFPVSEDMSAFSRLCYCVGLYTFGAGTLWFGISTTYELASGRHRLARLVARVCIGALGCGVAWFFEWRGYPANVWIAIGMGIPALYVLVLSGVLPGYSLTRVFSAQTHSRDPNDVSFLYDAKARRPFVRLAWACSRKWIAATRVAYESPTR